MLNITCSCCKEKLTQPGAIVLSPPDGDVVLKIHLCVRCFSRLAVLFEDQSLPDSPYTGAGVSSFKSSNEEREALASTRGYRMAQGDMSDFKRVKSLREEK